MLQTYRQHIIGPHESAREALRRLDSLPGLAERILFIVDDSNHLLGTLTDGDIRRGLLRDHEISHEVCVFMFANFKSVKAKKISPATLRRFRNENVTLVPVLQENGELIDVIDLTKITTILPITAVIMAGGKGERLRPLTEKVPKPMLHVGNKPIIEHNIDRLIQFGVREIYISINYLGDQIKNYFGDGSSKGISIRYVEENEPLGTIGALSLIPAFEEETIFLINSDLLTNIDLEQFYTNHHAAGANMSVASIPYRVQVPYAVLEAQEERVLGFVEKPGYNYYVSAGMYLISRDALKQWLPQSGFYNATDFMEKLIAEQGKLIHYPHTGYWLDIGKYADYIQAQEDIKYIRF
jgi:dTDP-glucose pyrophosphorylase